MRPAGQLSWVLLSADAQRVSGAQGAVQAWKTQDLGPTCPGSQNCQGHYLPHGQLQVWKATRPPHLSSTLVSHLCPSKQQQTPWKGFLLYVLLQHIVSHIFVVIHFLVFFL